MKAKEREMTRVREIKNLKETIAMKVKSNTLKLSIRRRGNLKIITICTHLHLNLKVKRIDFNNFTYR